jgi:putative ABC transport system substrate-binding protein
MKRRAFLSLIGGGAVAWPLAARGQQDLPRVGVLMSPAESDPEVQARVAAFRDGLQKLGWMDGQNVRLDFRWGRGDSARIKAYAAELVELAPRAIIANGTPAVAALGQATRTVPIVFAQVMDPIGLGYIDSFARPGRNMTGFTFMDFSLIGKWLDMLKAIAPATGRAALIYNPNTTPYWADYLRSDQAAQVSKAARLVGAPVRSESDLDTAIAEFAREAGGSLIFPPDPFNVVHFERSARLAQQHRLPTVSVYRKFAEVGGLAAYGPDTADIFRRSASYVDRILKGENPAYLPAQNPDRFEIVINLKTAKAIGVDVPPTLLATADEVIE